MKEIVFKDKVITITQDTLEVKRLPGKWFQSFYEVALIRIIISLFILSVFFIYILYLGGVSIKIYHFTTIMVGAIIPFTSLFLQYYKERSIPLNQIKDTNINRINQLEITYKGEKREMKQMINLPKNSSERENVVNQLQEEKLIEGDIPELPVGSEKKMHRNNLYLCIVGSLLSLVFYFGLLNIDMRSFVLVYSSIILLFAIISIIFSANRLLRMKKALPLNVSAK